MKVGRLSGKWQRSDPNAWKGEDSEELGEGEVIMKTCVSR